MILVCSSARSSHYEFAFSLTRQSRVFNPM